MRYFAIAAGLLILGAQGAASNSVMSRDAIAARSSDESTEIINNESSCRPAVSAKVVGAEGSGGSARTFHFTATQPVVGGGPVCIIIMRRLDRSPGPVIHDGAPLDGSPATVGH